MDRAEYVGIRNGRFIVRAGEVVIIGGIPEGQPLYHLEPNHVLKIDLLDTGKASLGVLELTGARKQVVKVSKHLKRTGLTMAVGGGLATVGLLIATPFFPPAACYLQKTISITAAGAGTAVIAGIAEKLAARVKYARISVTTKSEEALPPVYRAIADVTFRAKIPEHEYRKIVARCSKMTPIRSVN